MKKYLALDKRELAISVILVILFIGLFNYDVGSIRMLYWGITLGCSGLLLLINRNWKIDGFIVWYLFFLFLSGISLIWSISATTSLEILKSLLVNAVVLFAISNVIRSRKDVITVMRAMLIAFVSNAVYMIFKIDWSAIGNNRFDPEMTGEGWNANSLGLMAIWGLALIIIMPRKKKINWWEWLYIVPLVVILIFSGSRKAWLGALVVLLLGLFLKNRKKMFRNVLIAACAIILFVVLVTEIPFLYEIGGHRLEEMFAGFFGSGEADGSTLTREAYIRLGLEWFQNRPLLGHGADTYRCLLAESYFGRTTYSHNNYVELLVNGGIVTLVAFYSMYVYLVAKGLFVSAAKKFREDYNKNMILFFVGIVVLQMVLHVGFVAYSGLTEMLFLLLPFKLIRFDRSAELESK